MTVPVSHPTRRRRPTMVSRTRASAYARCTGSLRRSMSYLEPAAARSLACVSRSTRRRPKELAMSSPSWRVLVADDEPAARRGVRQLLSRFPQFAIVGECRDGREVLAALDALAP